MRSETYIHLITSIKIRTYASGTKVYRGQTTTQIPGVNLKDGLRI